MKNIISKDSTLYHFIQWAFFPLVLVGTPYIIYLLISAGYSIVLTTYIVAVCVGLVFWLAEWLMPFKEHWNHSHGDISNDLMSGIVAYIILPIFLKPLYIALLAGAAVWLSTQWGGAISDPSFNCRRCRSILGTQIGTYHTCFMEFSCSPSFHKAIVLVECHSPTSSR